jgi:YegS/Rv2252/BmrU family lipid kinase
MKKLLVVVNPISGRSSKKNVMSTIDSHIDRTKYDVTIRFTKYAGHAAILADEAVKSGVDVVVAVGGDGTVNEVAKALVHTNTTLGIIPCGSGNGLARHLHIPINIRKAVDLINTGAIESIDTLSVNGRPCFCTAGVGYDAQVSAEYAKETQRGLITYVRKAIEGWFKYEPQEYIIEVDNQTLKRKALAITCANANQWGNEFHVAPKASLKDGLVDVTIIHPIKFFHALVMPFQILGYSFDRNPDVECLKTEHLIIRRGMAGVMHIDGDAESESTEITVEILKNSLQVVCNTRDI